MGSDHGSRKRRRVSDGEHNTTGGLRLSGPVRDAALDEIGYMVLRWLAHTNGHALHDTLTAILDPIWTKSSIVMADNPTMSETTSSEEDDEPVDIIGPHTTITADDYPVFGPGDRARVIESAIEVIRVATARPFRNTTLTPGVVQTRSNTSRPLFDFPDEGTSEEAKTEEEKEKSETDSLDEPSEDSTTWIEQALADDPEEEEEEEEEDSDQS